MQVTDVTRVLVWGARLRLAHWTLALSTIGLMLSGWLMNNTHLMAEGAAEVHFMLSGLFLPALLLRIYLLLFGNGSEHLSSCEPNLHRLSQAWLVLKFYLTLGKAPLPRWYSHNPLWGPLYLALFFFLLLSAFSGLMLLKEISLISTLSLNHLHHLSYMVIGVFTLLHIPAVFSHDLSGKGSDISGMVNGYRVFKVESPGGNNKTGTVTHSVAVRDLMKNIKR